MWRFVKKYHYFVELAAILLVLMACAVTFVGDDEKDLERLVHDYFTSWSEQRMDDYKACFSPDAEIHFVDDAGKKSSFGLDRFVQLQTAAHLSLCVASDTTARIQESHALAGHILWEAWIIRERCKSLRSGFPRRRPVPRICSGFVGPMGFDALTVAARPRGQRPEVSSGASNANARPPSRPGRSLTGRGSRFGLGSWRCGT